MVKVLKAPDSEERLPEIVNRETLNTCNVATRCRGGGGEGHLYIYIIQKYTYVRVGRHRYIRVNPLEYV